VSPPGPTWRTPPSASSSSSPRRRSSSLAGSENPPSRGLLGTGIDWALGKDGLETVVDLGPKTHSDVVVNSEGTIAWGATGGFGTLVGAVLGSQPPTPTIHEVDLRTGNVRRTLLGHTEAIRTLALSPDGSRLASGSWDRTLRIWDLDRGEDRVLARFQEDVNGIAWSPDGALLIAAIDNGNVSVIDVASGALHTVAGHPRYTSHVAVSPDGRRFASGGTGNVQIWDLEAFRARLAGGSSD